MSWNWEVCSSLPGGTIIFWYFYKAQCSGGKFQTLKNSKLWGQREFFYGKMGLKPLLICVQDDSKSMWFWNVVFKRTSPKQGISLFGSEFTYLLSLIKLRRETSVLVCKWKRFTSMNGPFNSVSLSACTFIILFIVVKNLLEASQSLVIPFEPGVFMLPGLIKYSNLCKRLKITKGGYWTK